MINEKYDSNPDKYDIETINLTKIYTGRKNKKQVLALNNVNLKIKKGEIFGLLGPNGAGKTTFLSILTTLIQPTNGYAFILGRNILKDHWFIKNNISLMLGGDMIYTRITGYQNLKFFCKVYGVTNYKAKIKDFAEKFNLTSWLNQYVSNYSTGMKVKLALIRALITEPKVLFLDEPMLGVDPIFVNEMIKTLLGLNKTIILTSHQMNIVQRLCSRIGFLKEGKIIKVDTKDNFRQFIKDKIKIGIKIKKDSQNLKQMLQNLEYISHLTEENNTIFFHLNKRENYQDLFYHIKDFQIIQFNEIEPDLNEVFIRLSSED